MRPMVPLCLLAVFVTAASLCNRTRLRGRRQQASSSQPAVLVPLSVEDAARIAMAWPAHLHLMPRRAQ